MLQWMYVWSGSLCVCSWWEAFSEWWGLPNLIIAFCLPLGHLQLKIRHIDFHPDWPANPDLFDDDVWEGDHINLGSTGAAKVCARPEEWEQSSDKMLQTEDMVILFYSTFAGHRFESMLELLWERIRHWGATGMSFSRGIIWKKW